MGAVIATRPGFELERKTKSEILSVLDRGGSNSVLAARVSAVSWETKELIFVTILKTVLGVQDPYPSWTPNHVK